MLTFDDAVAEFQGAEAAGFDFSPERTAGLLNEGIQRFASRSEWIRAELDLGLTVAGQEAYTLPVNVVRLKALAVAGTPYVAVDVQTIWQYKLSGLPWRLDGAFAERYSPDGKLTSFGLLPIPETAGLALSGFGPIVPAALAGADPLPFDAEGNRGALEYAIAIAYEQADENPQSGTYYSERADAKADAARLLRQSRTGTGPYKIPVASARSRR